MTGRYDVFVSYADPDREVVAPFVHLLKRDGFKVWFDVEDLPGGRQIIGELADAIDASNHVIACLSDEYIRRKWTTFELISSVHLDPTGETSRTIPVRFRRLTLDPPNVVRHLKICDLTDQKRYMEQYEQITRLIHKAAPVDRRPLESDGIEKLSAAAFQQFDDPFLALFQVRRATEALAKFIYREHFGDLPADLTLDRLIDLLIVPNRLPREATAPLALLQTFGRQSVRDELDDLVVTRQSVAPALDALRMLTDWVFPGHGAQNTWAEVWRSLPVGESPDERCIPGTPYRLRGPRRSSNSLGPRYAGWDCDRNEAVSIILVALPPANDDRFLAEVAEFGRLRAGNILAPRAAGPVVIEGERRCLYLVLPPFDGVSVQDLVERVGVLPEHAAYELALAVATALVGFHEAEPPMVHGDIKPANVLIGTAGAVAVLCVGHQIAAAPAADLPQNADGRIDSFLFSSSEQRYGRPLTPATDLFALRSMLAYLVSGKYPAAGVTEPETLAPDAGTARGVLNRLAACASAVDARHVLRDACRALPADAPAAVGLQPLVRRYLSRGGPPQQQGRSPSTGSTGALQLVDVSPVACRLAWPVGDGLVLGWEAGTETLAVLRGAQRLWRDSQPVPVRRVTCAPGGRFAVGGWDGSVRCFTDGTLVAALSLDGAVGDLRYTTSGLVAGAWKRELWHIGGDGSAEKLLAVADGVHRIAVTPARDRFAVADLAGGIAIYAGHRRVATVPAAGPVADVAYAGARLVILTAEAVSGVGVDGTRTETVAKPGAFALLPGSDRGHCLMLVSAPGGDPPVDTVRIWRVDEEGRHIPHATLAPGETLLSLGGAGRRFTVATAAGGCAYRHIDEDVATWPDALSAQVSLDGRQVVVCRPGRVELYEDPA